MPLNPLIFDHFSISFYRLYTSVFYFIFFFFLLNDYGSSESVEQTYVCNLTNIDVYSLKAVRIAAHNDNITIVFAYTYWNASTELVT